MSIAHLLDDFGSQPTQSALSQAMAEEEVETLRLQSYEEGYKAGWEDAIKSQRDQSAHISDEFARNLQDLSFTYHEAHSQVMQAMTPLIQDIIDVVVPETVKETIGLRVVEQLSEMARRNGAHRVEIIVAPEDADKIRVLLDQDFGFPIEAMSDETLAEGQVFLRMAQEERQIDMEAVMSGIRQAVAGILQETERKMMHG
ncbi:MAG: ABC transporter ATP-binding protein [Pseudooceanicola atlanticus]